MRLRSCERDASVVVTPAAHRASGHSQQLQRNPNHHKDDADCPEDGNAGDEANDEQNDAEDYHLVPPGPGPFLLCALSIQTGTCPRSQHGARGLTSSYFRARLSFSPNARLAPLPPTAFISALVSMTHCLPKR